MLDPKTKRYLKISFGLHAGLFLLLLINDFVFPSRALIFQPSVQIDMVALPNQVKSDDTPVLDKSLPVKEDVPPPPPPEEKSEPEPAPAPIKEKAPAPSEKEAEKAAKSALERLRKEQAKKQKEDRKRQQEQLDKKEAQLKKFNETYRAALRGNQTHEGTNATGAMVEIKNAYAGHVTEELRRNWALPVYLQSQNLRAVVRIYIGSDGKVTRQTMIKGSGNELFDEYVKGAVNRSKFAPPPEELAKDLRNVGAEVTFPL